jgi:hypothetical protein
MLEQVQSQLMSGKDDLDMLGPAAKLLIGRDAFGENVFGDVREMVPLRFERQAG